MRTIDVLFSEKETIVDLEGEKFNIGNPNKVSVKREILNPFKRDIIPPTLSFQYADLIDISDSERAVLKLVNSNKNVFHQPIFTPSGKYFEIEIAQGYKNNIKYINKKK